MNMKVQGCSVVRVVDNRSKCLGSNPGHDQTLTDSEGSRQLSGIQGVGIKRCGHIERKNQETARLLLAFLKTTFGC